MNPGYTSTLKGAGTEGRSWVGERRTAPISNPDHAVISSPTWICMRDGVRLSATLHRPVGTERYPGILIANGYGATVEPSLAATVSRFVRHGYLVLCTRMRGMTPSEGKTGLYEGFATDTYDLVEWLARQPHCNGSVGMFGASLLGLIQYLGAREAPPSLKVIIPDDAGSDNYWYLWHPGGMGVGPGRASRRFVSGAEEEYPLAITHPNFDAFWSERTVQAADLQEIARRGISVFITSGWDSYLLGSTKSYEWLKAGDPGKRLKMFVGPWGHGAFMSAQPSPAGPAVLPYTGFEYGLMWLDRWLKGIANGVDDEPPVLIYVQGPNEWRFEWGWPLPDEQRVCFYLHHQTSGTSAGLNDGSLWARPPSHDRPATYEYSPTGPYNLAAVTVLSRQRIDKTPYESHGLAWTSEPLTAPTEMTGYPRIEFWCAMSAHDTDFVVEITDVGPADQSGRLQSLQVTRGYLNAMRYFSRSHPQPLISGKVYRFGLELYPTSYVFASGHRIRVTLQGSAVDPLAKLVDSVMPEYADVDPALLTITHGPGLNEQAARVTVLQDGHHPAFVDLPIIGQLGLT